MACDAPGSWANYAAGVGLDGPVSGQTLDELVQFYRQYDRPARIHLTPYQHPSLAHGLDRMGFVPIDHDVVLLHRLRSISDIPLDAVNFRRVSPNNTADVDAFCQSQAHGHLENQAPLPGFTAITRRVTQSPVVMCWLIEKNGVVVGSGGLEVHGHRGTMIAACTHPGSRGLGIQTAFMAFRMQRAAEQGVRLLTVASMPGGTTENNARRLGFLPAYSFETLSLSNSRK